MYVCACVCHRITVREPPPFAFIEWKASIHANFTRAAQCRMRAHCSSSCCCCWCLCLCLCCCSASLLLSFFRCPELSALCTLLKTRNCGRPANSCSVYFWRQCQAGRQGGREEREVNLGSQAGVEGSVWIIHRLNLQYVCAQSKSFRGECRIGGGERKRGRTILFC